MLNRIFRSYVAVVLFATSLSAVAQNEPSAKVTFEDAVTAASEQSFDVQRARIAVLAAKTDQVKTIAQMGPYSYFTYNDNTYSTPIIDQNLVIQAERSQTGRLALGLDLTRLIAGLIEVWSQASQITLTSAQKDQVVIQTAFTVAQVYRLAQQANMAVDVAKSRLDAATKQQKDTEATFTLGRINKSDKLDIDLIYNNSILGLKNAENDRLKTHSTLKKLIGNNSEGPLQLDVMKDLNADMVTVIPNQDDAIIEALSSRADLMTAAQAVTSYSTGSWLRLAPYLPHATMEMNWQWNFGTLSALSPFPSFQYTALNLKWSFWDSGASLADFHRARLDVRKARVDLAEKTFDVKNDAELAVRDLALAKDTLHLRDVGLEKAQEAFRGSETLFKLGRVSGTEFLVAESTLNQARLDHLAATVGIDIAYMKMQQALGRKRPVPL